MTGHADTEDKLVEQPAIGLFAELSEQEPTIFDILTRRLAQARQLAGKVRIEIEDTLEALPRAYTTELFKSKSEVLFEHVYESYFGDGGSAYAEAA